MDFSMALLLVENRVIDWASCWTCNRTANQDLLLEDVDGDGFLDVAFRARDGWFGLKDRRQYSVPGDSRKWLYAYAITTKGFQSLFPRTDHDFKVRVSYHSADQPVKLLIKGLPKFLREHEMVKCTFLATNTSNKDLAIPAEWFKVDSKKACLGMTYSLSDKKLVLKPGETISQVIGLIVGEVKNRKKEVTVRCSFVPSGAASNRKAPSTTRPIGW
jgi:hypothetical protein